MTGKIETIAELEAHYATTGSASLVKVAKRVTRTYRAWINASRFCVLTTVGADGTNGSPRGDEGPVVHELESSTLAMPDWHGNNRIDSLRNIVQDGRVSLMFMVPGSNSVLRAAFDIGVADTQVLDVPVEFGLELMTVICPDLSDAERELLNGVIHEVDRVGLSVLFVNLQSPNTCRVVNCSVLETPNLLTPFLNEYQGLNIHLDVMA